MGFLKLTGLVIGVAVLASYLTFITTKDYYSENNRLGSLCPDSSASLEIASPSSFEKFSVHPAIVVTSSSDEVPKNNSLVSAQPKQQLENIENLVRQREAQQQQIDSFRKFVTAAHKKSLIEETDLRYEAEPVNYQWSSTQEDKLLSAFISSPALESFTPTHMSCRSSTCKITIPVQDDNNAEEAYHSVWQALVSDNQNANQAITYFRDSAKGEVVVYISAQENSMFK